KVPAGLFDFVVRRFRGLSKLELAVRRQADQAAELLAAVAEDPEKPRDPMVEIVVDLDRCDGLVQQDRRRPAEWLHIGLVWRKISDDPVAQVSLASMPFDRRPERSHFCPLTPQAGRCRKSLCHRPSV